MKRPIPKMAAALVPRELTNWSLTSITLGVLEGGLLGVIVKNQFDDVASPAAVNLAVAIVAGAPSFTNLASFLYSSWSSGRDKIQIMSWLMQLMGIVTVLMALPPNNAVGLFLFCFLTLVARTAWSGILTLRASVWRANYPREWRAQITARLVRLSSLLVAVVAALVGFLLDWQEDFYRLCFVLAGICSLFAARIYGQARIRRHGQLLAKERAMKVAGRRHISLAVFGEVLRGNHDFRNYMSCMMVFGSANVMVIPMLVVMLNEQFQLSQWRQVMITSSLPLVVMCLAVPFWANVLDRKHIFTYRAIHSWYYVLCYIFLHWPWAPVQHGCSGRQPCYWVMPMPGPSGLEPGAQRFYQRFQCCPVYGRTCHFDGVTGHVYATDRHWFLPITVALLVDLGAARLVAALLFVCHGRRLVCGSEYQAQQKDCVKIGV